MLLWISYTVTGVTDSEASVLDLLLCLLLQRADWLGRALAGGATVQGEQLQPLAVAHGLLQVAGLVHKLLNGAVLLH